MDPNTNSDAPRFMLLMLWLENDGQLALAGMNSDGKLLDVRRERDTWDLHQAVDELGARLATMPPGHERAVADALVRGLGTRALEEAIERQRRYKLRREGERA